VTWEHDRVEELLAGRILGGLDPEDAELAERALLEHVPGCDRCKLALDGFRLVAGDLALAADPVQPPDLVWARIRRSTMGRPPRRLRTAGILGAAAAVAAIGLLGWNLMLSGQLAGRLSDAEVQQAWVIDALSTLSNPSSEVLPLGGSGEQRVAVMYVPGEEQVYVIAAQLPDPEFVYHVWFTGGGRTWDAGVLEVDRGVGMMPVRTDPEQWEIVMITDEPDRRRPEPRVSPLVSATVSAD
jgi:hypothetical protein